jgi:hypothetical protein
MAALTVNVNLRAALLRKMKRDQWLHMARGMRIAGASYPAIFGQLKKEACDIDTAIQIVDAITECEQDANPGGEE